MLDDIRFAFRQLTRRPLFSAAAILTVALGIGATTAIFSVVHAVLLRQLPFRDPSRLVSLAGAHHAGFPEPGQPGGTTSAKVSEWVVRYKILDGVAVYRTDNFNLIGAGEPARIAGAEVSANFFGLLGVSPILGRTFLSGEDLPGKDGVAILSESLWRTRFGASSNAVGRTIDLQGSAYQIVGVLPAGAEFPSTTAVWIPTAFDEKRVTRLGAVFWETVGRLKDGVSVERCSARLAEIGKPNLEQQVRKFGNRFQFEIRVKSLAASMTASLRSPLLLFSAAVGFVLLIVCANLANLMLGRTTERKAEIALRAALGAGRWRNVRHLLAESLAIASAGGLIGIFIGWWGVRALLALRPADLSAFSDVPVSLTVLGFSIGVSLLCGFIFGAIPAWLGSRTDLNDALKQGSRSAGESRPVVWLRNVLVASQIAVALLLITGAGMLLRSFLNLQSVKPGFDVERVVGLTVERPGKSGPETADPNRPQFLEEAMSRLKSIGGVEAVGATNNVPLDRKMVFSLILEQQGRTVNPDNPIALLYHATAGDYFKAMSIPLLRGRLLNANDRDNPDHPILISATAAKQFWPSEDPLGVRVRSGHSNEWWTIVGIVGDTRTLDLSIEPMAEMYLSYSKGAPGNVSFVLRFRRDLGSLAKDAAAAIHTVNPTQPVYNILTLRERFVAAVSGTRFQAILIAIFSALALLIAAVGIFGVISYSVTRRTRDIGIRMALGADSNKVMRAVLWQGLRVSLFGLAAGAVASYWLVKLIRGFLFEVKETDATIWVISALVMLIAALAATYWPARRASRMNPVTALRWE